MLPYHVLSPVLQHSSFRSDLTPPPATSSEFIYTHPAYRKLCALDPAALARVEAKHPVLGPVIENINKKKSADTSDKTRPSPATSVDKAKKASASANEEEEYEAEGKRPPVVSARASRAFSAIPVVDGRAMVTLLNGDVYQGETKDGKKHGRGVYRFKNGDWSVPDGSHNVKGISFTAGPDRVVCHARVVCRVCRVRVVGWCVARD